MWFCSLIRQGALSKLGATRAANAKYREGFTTFNTAITGDDFWEKDRLIQRAIL